MKINYNMGFVYKSLENSSLSKVVQNELYIFISQNITQFFEISDRTVIEVKNIKDGHPNNWKEM